MAGYKKYKKEDESSYALGITLTFEMLSHRPQCCERVYVHSSMKHNETYDRLMDLCRRTGTEVVASDKVFRVLSDKENCYVIGQFHKFSEDPDPKRPHIVLVNPSNAGNLGTIFRSALGFGFEDIVIIEPAVDVFDPKAVRSSMGALFSLRVRDYRSFEEYRQKYEKGREFFPFMLQASRPMKDIHPSECYSLIFGNEATGLPESYLHIGTPVIIPISQKIDSLNLPVAASIAMYAASSASGQFQQS